MIFSEKWKDRYLRPKQEFRELLRKVDTTLNMYKNLYTNPLDKSSANQTVIDRYYVASKAVREASIELFTYDNMYGNAEYYGVKTTKLREAAHGLMGLSNSFFLPYDCTDISQEIKSNRQCEMEIREALGIVEQSGK